MVDAINAINAATRSVAQERKNPSIDWRRLTANQVLEYADQGEDVPVEILRWAEDYAKITNAPDDVTYDSVNGSVESQDAMATEEADETSEDGANEIENSGEENDDDAGTATTMSLYDQAGVLIQESGTSRKNVNRASGDAVVKVVQGQAIAAAANQETKIAEIIARSRKAEYDELLKKLENDKSSITPQDLMKLDRLAGQLSNIGKKVQSDLTIYDAQLQEIETVFSEYDELPPIADTKGKETVDVGSQLLTNNSEHQADVHERSEFVAHRKFGKLLLNPIQTLIDAQMISTQDYLRGIHAVAAGTRAMRAAFDGENILSVGHRANNLAINQIVEDMDKIEDITLVEGNRAEINTGETTAEENNGENTVENNAPETNNKPEESSSTAENKDENEAKDTAILTDPLEIQRRKENRGEVPPNAQA